MTQRTLTIWVLLTFIVALATPAFSLAGDSLFGWGAAGLSFLGSAIVLAGDGLVNERGQGAACLCGALANLLLLAALVGGFCQRRTWTVRCAGAAAAAGLLSVVALLTGGERFVPFIGCGLWIGAMLWLAIGSALRPATAPAGR
jgi:hypothetical protein